MRILAIILILALSACGLVDDTDTNRTYPPAQDYPLVSIESFNKTVPLPGSYNLRGYVISFSECPPHAFCIIADGFTLFSRNELDPDHKEVQEKGIRIAANKPSQFVVGGDYVISVVVDHERVPEAAWPTAQIVGYSRLR